MFKFFVRFQRFRETLGMAKPILSDKQWARLEPHLPRYPGVGRPENDNRVVLEGILWILRNGARWRDLPSDFDVSPATCWQRLHQWDDEGIWQKVWRRFMAELDRRGQLNRSESFIDGRFIRAKMGATALAQTKRGKVTKWMALSTARVVHWETTWPARRPWK